MKQLLRDPNVAGNPVLAVMDVAAIEDVSPEQLSFLVERTFRTMDPKHPGVADFTAAGNVLISGPIEVLNFSYFPAEFPDTFRTAGQIREEITKRGWKKVVMDARGNRRTAKEDLALIDQAFARLSTVIAQQTVGAREDFEFHLAIARASCRYLVVTGWSLAGLDPKNTMRSVPYQSE